MCLKSLLVTLLLVATVCAAPASEIKDESLKTAESFHIPILSLFHHVPLIHKSFGHGGGIGGFGGGYGGIGGFGGGYSGGFGGGHGGHGGHGGYGGFY